MMLKRETATLRDRLEAKMGRSKYTSGTIRAYSWQLKNFIDFVDATPKKLNVVDMQSYFKALKAEKKTRSFFLQASATLGFFYREIYPDMKAGVLLEKLHQQYKAKGLMLVALPANDFGSQEKGSNAQIADFCKINYGVSFTVGEKLSTPIGKDPLYQKLIAASGQAPAWNFHKYLVTPNGKVQSFDSATEPMSATLTKAIGLALAAPSPAVATAVAPAMAR